MSLRILICARDLSWQGGVVNFLSLMVSVLSSDVLADIFTVGRRPGKDTFFQRAIQTIVDGGKLFIKLRNKSYDIVHLNPSLNKASLLRDGYFLLILRMLTTQKVLVFFRGWEEPIYQKVIANRLYLFLFKSLFLKADRIVVLGKIFQEKLDAIGVEKQKIVILSAMFNGQSFKNLEKVRADKEFHFVFLGRYIAEKGLIELLEGFRFVLKNKKSVKLLLAGDGPLKQKMASWIKKHEMSNHIILFDYLQGKTKAQFLVNGDCFILPSYSEGCPNALIEAMAAGLVVITTSVGGIPDIIDDGTNGILLNEVSPLAISLAMKKVLENQCLRDTIRKANKKKSWENYEANSVTQKIESIYRELVHLDG